MKRILPVVFALALVIPATAAPDMKEGEWEVTVTTEMPGMPFAMPAMKNTTCITRENMVPQRGEAGRDCTMKEQKVEGNTVSWAMECKNGKDAMTSQGKVTYQGDSFAGTMNSVVGTGGEKMQLNQKISGRRLGPCK